MRKLLCTVLTVLMVFCAVMPASAVDTGTSKNYDGYPLVVVRGIDFGGLYTADGEAAIKVELSDIFGFVKDYFQQRFLDRNDEAFFDCALSLVGKIFDPIMIDKDGKSVHELYFDKYESSMAAYADEVLLMEDIGETGIIKTAVDAIGAENVYYFTYDWRMSARYTADKLNSFIENALTESGKEKVNIIAVSMGGMVTTSYLYDYGSDIVNTLLYVSSAHNGTYGPGDAFNGDIYIDGNVIYNSIRKSFDGKLISCFFVDLINKIGVFDAITAVANKIIGENPQVINNDTVRNGFGTLLGLWAMCPDDVFESGVEFFFGGREDEYPVLLEKLSETGEFIYSTEKTIDEAIESGVKVSFLSNYNTPLACYYKHSYMQGDGVLETALTSNFATVAPYGEKLSDEQLAAADKGYVSPDGIIDASTALYRDVTWFVKDAVHVAAKYGSDYADFVMWLLLCDEQPTVRTNPAYPQFMYLDENEKLLITE